MAKRKSASPSVDDGDGSTDDKLLDRARKDYALCREAWQENQRMAQEDMEFAELGGDYQWPETSAADRRREGRPAETFNKMPTFIRQVVNDARQNKPQIKVHPQDGDADPRVAEIISGLIRNIETTSDADVAYDTAINHAVGRGYGFWRINTAYTSDDAFDQDIVVERISNPFTVYGDPRSTAADSSDWNVAIVATNLSKDEFEREYPEAERVNWSFDFRECPDWLDGDDVVVAEWWTREKVMHQVVALSDGSIVRTKVMEERPDDFDGLKVVGPPRDVEGYKVTQRICSGAEILKTVEWPGKYIPIVPVYGDEVVDERGRRHFRSLIRDAKGAQRMYNYMRNTGIEGLGLQPRVPYIGEEGSFVDGPGGSWDNANTASLPYLEYKKGSPPPQRQPLPSHYSAALQEALSANDDMKALIGIHDASLGIKSNETSGRAIMARQREGDVSTFHFIDNLSRAIRHGGRILLDLIPKVYTTERIVRVLGEDLKPSTQQIAPTGQPVQEQADEAGNIIGRIFDITAGKYDLTVSSGPSYTTMREENRVMMTEMAQAGGEVVASVLIPRIAKLMDIPDADKIAGEIEAKLNPQQAQGGVPPQVQEMIQQGQQVIQQQGQQLQQAGAKIQELTQANALKMRELDIKEQAEQTRAFEAETRRMEAMQPTFVRTPPASQPGLA